MLQKKILGERPNELIYFRKCSNCNFEVDGRAAKLIIEACEGCSLTITCDVISGTMEVINSSNIKTDTKALIPTVTVDNTNNCTLVVPAKWATGRGLGGLYTSKSNEITVVKSLPDETQQTFKVELPAETPISEFARPALADNTGNGDNSNALPWQYVSRFVEGKFQTELVTREGAGYATTVREKTAADKKDAEFQRRLVQVLNSTLKPLEKAETKTTTF